MGKSLHAKLTTTAGRIILAVYTALILLMGAATFMQQAHGASYAAQHVYGTAWFSALWGILLLLSLYIITVRARMWKQFPLFLLHLALAVILLGAGVTHFTSHEGTIHLRAGNSTDRYATADGSVEHLPFTLRLDSFRTVYYPGTNTPADFVSHLHDATVSMNHPLRREGYRFYQAGFDPDGQGARLSVTYDPWGTPLTYFGYALLALSMIWVSLRPSARKHRHQGAKALLLMVFLLSAPAVQARSIPSVSADKAEQAARMPVVWNGRVAPFNTLARDVVQKVYGRTSYKGLRAEQVVLGWAARPEVWKDEPMIRVKDRALRRQLGLSEGNYATMAALFTPDGRYRLEGLPPDKAVRELDEQVGLLLMLANGTLVQPATEADISPARIEAELLYNAIPFTKTGFMASLTLGLLLLLFPRVRRFAPTFGLLLLLYLLCGYALRWYIGGRIPLSNGSETMQFLALCALAASMHRRLGGITPALPPLVGGFALLVSWLGERSPQVTSLVPVLNSPLLSLHVSIIMVAYALLALSAAGSLAALFRPTLRQPLLERGTRLLRPAVFLLAAGIFLGAVWANVSWGSYWSWDPKETWALITLMVYAVPLHTASLPALRRPLVYHCYQLFAFLTLLMTYFGVNYFLGGMHSYA